MSVWKTHWHGLHLNLFHCESAPLLKMRLLCWRLNHNTVTTSSEDCLSESGHSCLFILFDLKANSWKWTRVRLGHIVLCLAAIMNTFPLFIWVKKKHTSVSWCCLRGASLWIFFTAPALHLSARYASCDGAVRCLGFKVSGSQKRLKLQVAAQRQKYQIMIADRTSSHQAKN